MRPNNLKSLPREISDLADISMAFKTRTHLSWTGEELFNLDDRCVRVADDAIMFFRYGDLRKISPLKSAANVPAAVASRAALFDPLGLDPKDQDLSAINRLANNNFFSTDPQKHKALKPVFAQPLLPAHIGQFIDTARNVANRLTRNFTNARPVEFVEDFAQALALGVWAELFDMSNDEMVGLREAMSGMTPLTMPGAIDHDILERFKAAIPNYLALLTEVLARAKANGTVGFITHMARLYDAIDDRSIAMPESCEAMAATSMLDAFDALGGAVASCGFSLVSFPEIQEHLAENPSSATNIVSEALRLYAPVRIISRYAVEDFEFEGMAIPSGTSLLLNWGAAGRDPAAFAAPHTFDLTRAQRAPATFGGGRQVCPGQNLVRALCKIALEAISEANIRIRPAGTASWQTVKPISYNARLERLPVAFATP